MIKTDEDLSAVDNIAVICSALCDCCDSVVLFYTMILMYKLHNPIV